eukprot:7181611-Prymnesium_polylepis.1
MITVCTIDCAEVAGRPVPTTPMVRPRACATTRMNAEKQQGYETASRALRRDVGERCELAALGRTW